MLISKGEGAFNMQIDPESVFAIY